VHAFATRHRPSGRRSWATEIIALVDEGRYRQAARLVGVLAECGPDTATAQVLRHARPQIERLMNDPAGEVGCRAGARGAVHALLAGAASAPRARPTPGADADPGVRLAQWPLAVRVFGPLEVWVHGHPVTRLTSRPGRAVLRVLAVNRGRPVPRAWLMDQLWPEASASAAANSLNVAVHGLRRALCAAHPEGARLDYVACRDGAYELAPGLAAWVDVEQFERHRALGRAARSAGDELLAAAHFQTATDLQRGPLFEDDGADWHVERRLALQDNCCDMLEGLAELLLGLGEVERAEQTCRRLLAIDPSWEGGHRQLMRSLVERGEYGRAVRQYGRCAAVLARELDVVPDGRTTALYQAVKTRMSAG
jgi:DNA-binding SARP family transcriptional activator